MACRPPPGPEKRCGVNLSARSVKIEAIYEDSTGDPPRLGKSVEFATPRLVSWSVVLIPTATATNSHALAESLGTRGHSEERELILKSPPFAVQFANGSTGISICLGGLSMKNASVLLAALTSALILVSGPLFEKTACAGDTIRLGFVADATGAGAPWYKSQKQGIDLFIEECNAAGGVLGRKLELVERDSALDPDKGEVAAEDLIVNEKCDFLLGPSSSGVALRVTKIAKKYRKIVVFHSCNSESLTTTAFQPYMFEVAPNTGIEARGVAHFYALRPPKRFAYLGPDYDYARNWWANFKAAITRAKPDVQFVSETWVQLGETNFSWRLPAIMAANPEVVVTNMWGESLEKFIRQVKASGLLDRADLTCLCDLELLKSMGADMPEKILGHDRCAFYSGRHQRMQDFVDRFHAKYQDWPACWAAMSYDGLIALTEAIAKAGTLDSDAVVRAFEGQPYSSIRGTRFIRAEDHMADVGVYVGWTGKDSRFDKFLILKDLTRVPADLVWLPVDEVKKLQSEQRLSPTDTNR